MAAVTKGLWVPLEARPGKEEDVATFLEGGRSLVEDEPTRQRGSRSGSATRNSPSSTSSQMTRAARHTCPDEWPRH
jgi:hypothetical protein